MRHTAKYPEYPKFLKKTTLLNSNIFSALWQNVTCFPAYKFSVEYVFLIYP